MAIAYALIILSFPKSAVNHQFYLTLCVWGQMKCFVRAHVLFSNTHMHMHKRTYTHIGGEHLIHGQAPPVSGRKLLRFLLIAIRIHYSTTFSWLDVCLSNFWLPGSKIQYVCMTTATCVYHTEGLHFSAPARYTCSCSLLPGNQILIRKYLARKGVVVSGGWSNGSGWQQTTTTIYTL